MSKKKDWKKITSETIFNYGINEAVTSPPVTKFRNEELRRLIREYNDVTQAILRLVDYDGYLDSFID